MADAVVFVASVIALSAACAVLGSIVGYARGYEHARERFANRTAMR